MLQLDGDVHLPLCTCENNVAGDFSLQALHLWTTGEINSVTCQDWEGPYILTVYNIPHLNIH